MKKRTRRIASTALSLILCSSMTLNAFAAAGTVEVETTSGQKETVDVNITISEQINENGSTTVNTTANGIDVTENGYVVDYRGESTMTTDQGGNTTGEASEEYRVFGDDYVANGGSETTIEQNTPTGTLDIPMEEGGQSTITGDPVGTTDTTGNVPEGDDDGEYDFIRETVTTQGKVTVTTEKVEVTNKGDANGGDLDYVHADVEINNDNDLFFETAAGWNGQTSYEQTEGYGYTFMGSGNSSQFYAGFLYKSPASEDEAPAYIAPDGTKYYTRRGAGGAIGGKYQVEGGYMNGEKFTDEKIGTIWGNVAQYVLMDGETGELITTYCADQKTYTQDGFGYNIENLEDAGYYDEEQAAMIRTVALNGYWGTSEGIGSLDAVKDVMRNAKDKDGNDLFTEEEINGLTDGAAMTATQFAIWNFSNYMDEVHFFNTHYVPDKANNQAEIWNIQHLSSKVPTDKLDDAAVIFKLYNHLINMDPSVVEEKTTSNTVINETNFVDNLKLDILGKDKEDKSNRDSDPTNDSYVANLSFALVVTPSEENGDNLVVKLIDAEGNERAVGRITGEAQEGETVLIPDENGNYSFENIVISEGEQNFNITLEGIQNLQEGVYLYSSEVRTDEAGEDVSSQTMVGVASGERAVSVSMNIKFDVDVEDEIKVTERIWRSERVIEDVDPDEDDPDEYEEIPEEDPPLNDQPENDPYEDISDDDVPMDDLVEIEDEEVPLAAVPQTGDASVYFAILSALSGTGLAGLALTKKREEN